MKVLILHLSDIHIKTANDVILARGKHIVDAVKNLEIGLDLVLCVVSGDTVFSGQDEEYLLALDFIGGIKTDLESALSPLPCELIVVPGNHDCLFPGAGVRNSILPGIIENPNLLTEASHAAICLEPLKNFFDFRAALLPNYPTSEQSKIYCEHRFSKGGQNISLLCYNTAITSVLREQAGQLVYPINLIPSQRPHDDVVISVFHHPTNWLTPNCGREFRKRMEEISDIALTGHEHVLDARQIQSTHGDASYVEGGALQESAYPNVSEFNVLILDTAIKRRRHIVFSWTGHGYEPPNASNPDDFYLWEDFTQNSYRMRQSYQVNEQFKRFLNDVELTLTHRVKGAVLLSDIYIYPDLKRIKQPGEKGTEVVKSEGATDLILSRPHLFIVGDDGAGKTAFAKRTFDFLRSKGDVPVYIDAAKQRLNIKTCIQDIEHAFLKCYSADALETYRQCDRARRVLIIDNYHRSRVPARFKAELLESIKAHSYRVILFAHDTALTLYDLAVGDSASSPFAFYSILPFSYIQQDRIIEKWLLLGGEETDPTTFVSSLEKIRRAMDAIFGKNYVPPYPPYILSILQASEAAIPLDLKANAHGYFYELFITQLIAKNSSSAVAINILKAYLSHIAYAMHRSQTLELILSDIEVLHNKLSDEFEVLDSFASQIDHLVKMQILTPNNDALRFRQPYIYYYFLAFYLHNHVDEAEVIEAINEMVRHLYREEFASTLLFLSHLTKDKRILEAILAVSSLEFVEFMPARLEGDIEFLRSLQTDFGAIEIPDKDFVDLRREELARLERERIDELEYEQVNKSELESHATLLGRLNAAIKTIQILGQYLKNFPADLAKSEKDRIVLSAVELGGRVLAGILGLIRENQENAVKGMVCLLAKRNPELQEEELRKKAAGVLSTLSELASTGMIWRLAQALGSSELMQAYDRFFGEQSSSFLKLIHLALKLDHNAEFPEAFLIKQKKEIGSSAFIFRLLQNLVSRRLFMFPADYRLKQKLSELLNLDYKKIVARRPEQQLLK
jgi:hypothetical protein